MQIYNPETRRSLSAEIEKNFCILEKLQLTLAHCRTIAI